MSKSSDILFGKTEDHLISIPHHDGHKMHKNILQAWNDLVSLGSSEGIEIRAISSFRSFESQKRIWNLKATGQRILLDDHENTIAFEDFNLEKEDERLSLVQTILRWSALPGLSRHHWGTEIDIIDAQALKEHPNYKVQLVSSEYAQGGIFEKLGSFLNHRLSQTEFYRPYAIDLGGVAPEPWHLSHRKQSEKFFRKISISQFRDLLEQQGESIELGSTIHQHLEELFERFFLNINT